MIDYEQQRTVIQSTLDRQKTPAERNRLGQFGTSTELAREIIAYSASLLSPNVRIRFLDPAIGTGSFYSALRESVSPELIETAIGYEIDEHYGVPAQQLWSNTPLKIQLADFTLAVPPTKESEQFNLLVCNPPYVRHHHIINGDKLRLQDITNRASGVRLSGLAGLYCYFVLLAHSWVMEQGIATWLIPSEFMDVNYGRALKEYLLDRVTLLRIHRFDPNDLQFADALVSSAIVWFRKEHSPTEYTVDFTFGGTVSAPNRNGPDFPFSKSANLNKASRSLIFSKSSAVLQRVTIGFSFLRLHKSNSTSYPKNSCAPFCRVRVTFSKMKLMQMPMAVLRINTNFSYWIAICRKTPSKQDILPFGSI